MSASAKTHVKQWTTIALLLVVPVAAGVVFFWKLHTPTPRTRTSVVLNRNSLLPHRFAGACINCHRIDEIGPVEMNQGNMRFFNLTPSQRNLLMRGQKVDVPSITQRIRMPAITRDDVLPHPYVGVCSNCHIVLAIRPADEWFATAMNRAYQPLTAAPATLPADHADEWIERGGTTERESREMWRNVWGFVALVCFLIGGVYLAMRGLMRRDPKRWRGKLDIKKWFVVHEWASSAACIAAVLHWHYSDRGNNFLHLSLIIVVWLTVAGYILRYRFATKNTRKRVQLLHSQRFLYAALIVLLIVGHFFAEFY